MTPTARSLVELRARGALAEVVERFIRLPKDRGRVPFRRDLFGFADIVAIEPGRSGVLAVQACRTADQADRLAKIRGESRARIWLRAGNRIAVWGWAKRGPRGKRKTWTLSETIVDAAGRVIEIDQDGLPVGPARPAMEAFQL